MARQMGRRSEGWRQGGGSDGVNGDLGSFEAEHYWDGSDCSDGIDERRKFDDSFDWS